MPKKLDFKVIKRLNRSLEERYYICEKEPLYFFIYYFSQYLTYPIAPFHYDFFDDIKGLVDGTYDSVAWIAFRESSKTTIAKLALVVWSICFEKKHYINIDSFMKEDAEAFLFDVAIALQTNELLLRDFGNLYFGDNVNAEGRKQSKIKRLSNFITENDIKLEAFSTQQSTRGRVYKYYRPDLYVLDDIETNKTKDSIVMTNSIISHIDELKSGLGVGGSVLYLGNMITESGSIAHILKSLERSKKAVIRNIPASIDGVPTWGGKYVMTDLECSRIRRLRMRQREAGEEETLQPVSLEAKRRFLGDKVYETEMMNNPEKSGDLVFDRRVIIQLITRAIEPHNIVGGLKLWGEYNAKHRYGMGCLPDGEKVLTGTGLKNIEDVDFQDMLVDKDGKNVEIKNIQRRYYEGDIFEIKPHYSSMSTKFTEEHPILVLKDNKMYRKSIKEGGERFYKTNVAWKKAKDLTEKDIIKLPIRFTDEMSNTEILTHFPIQDNIRIDRRVNPEIILEKDFWFFIGLWLAEGWIYKTKNGRKTISLALSEKKELELAKKIRRNCKRLFNRSVGFTTKGRGSRELKFSSEIVYEFIINNFGQKAKNKDIKEWIKYLPKELKLALFDGYVVGDGCEIEDKKQRLKINCVSISEKLLYDFQEILLSIGVVSSVKVLREEGYHIIRENKVSHCQKTFSLDISARDSDKILKNNAKFSRKRHKGYGWIDGRYFYVKIAKIKKSHYKGNVNNFETKTHSYQSPFIVTHNCDTSEGIGEDANALAVIDFSSRPAKVVATLKDNKIAPDIFAYDLKRAGNIFGGCIIAPEINSVGFATLATLKDIYNNIYVRESKENIGDVVTTKYGFRTTRGNKADIIYRLKTAVEDGDLVILDEDLLLEMKYYTKQHFGLSKTTEGLTQHFDLLMACFVKGTNVLTDKGQKPIETISVGDKVLTRNGYKRVISTMSRLKKVITNIGLTGTPDHPIICADGSTQQLQSLNGNDRLYIWNSKKKEIGNMSFTEAQNIIGIQNQKEEPIESILWGELNGKNQLLICIGKFGKIILGLFQKVLSYTIKMVTQVTMSLKTLLVYLLLIICELIWENQNERRKSEISLTEKIIEQNKRRAFKNIIELKFLLFSLVRGVARNMEQLFITLNTALNTAANNSKINTEENQKQREGVLSAEKGSRRVTTKSIAPENASRYDKENALEVVYNLEIEDTPEYFANNILVHNCAIAWEMLEHSRVEKKKSKFVQPPYQPTSLYEGR